MSPVVAAQTAAEVGVVVEAVAVESGQFLWEGNKMRYLEMVEVVEKNRGQYANIETFVVNLPTGFKRRICSQNYGNNIRC